MVRFSEHFTDKDFPLGVPHPDFLSKLEQVRVEYGKPIYVTSGGRDHDKNASVGGAENSAHLIREGNRFRAADLLCEDSTTRYYLLKAVLKYFNRVGVYPKHCHIDDDPTKPPNVVWYGG